jgi:hypothetical protein
MRGVTDDAPAEGLSRITLEETRPPDLGISLDGRDDIWDSQMNSRCKPVASGGSLRLSEYPAMNRSSDPPRPVVVTSSDRTMFFVSIDRPRRDSWP